MASNSFWSRSLPILVASIVPIFGATYLLTSQSDSLLSDYIERKSNIFYRDTVFDKLCKEYLWNDEDYLNVYNAVIQKRLKNMANASPGLQDSMDLEEGEDETLRIDRDEVERDYRSRQ